MSMKYECRDERERVLEEKKGRNEKEKEKVYMPGLLIRLMLWIAQGRNVTSAYF